MSWVRAPLVTQKERNTFWYIVLFFVSSIWARTHLKGPPKIYDFWGERDVAATFNYGVVLCSKRQASESTTSHPYLLLYRSFFFVISMRARTQYEGPKKVLLFRESEDMRHSICMVCKSLCKHNPNESPTIHPKETTDGRLFL